MPTDGRMTAQESALRAKKRRSKGTVSNLSSANRSQCALPKKLQLPGAFPQEVFDELIVLPIDTPVPATRKAGLLGHEKAHS